MKVGDTVKLKKGVVKGKVPTDRKNHRTAKILALLKDVEGGVFVERDLAGHKYWNVKDLEIVEP